MLNMWLLAVCGYFKYRIIFPFKSRINCYEELKRGSNIYIYSQQNIKPKIKHQETRLLPSSKVRGTINLFCNIP